MNKSRVLKTIKWIDGASIIRLNRIEKTNNYLYSISFSDGSNSHVVRKLNKYANFLSYYFKPIKKPLLWKFGNEEVREDVRGLFISDTGQLIGTYINLFSLENKRYISISTHLNNIACLQMINKEVVPYISSYEPLKNTLMIKNLLK